MNRENFGGYCYEEIDPYKNGFGEGCKGTGDCKEGFICHEGECTVKCDESIRGQRCPFYPTVCKPELGRFFRRGFPSFSEVVYGPMKNPYCSKISSGSLHGTYCHMFPKYYEFLTSSRYNNLKCPKLSRKLKKVVKSNQETICTHECQSHNDCFQYATQNLPGCSLEINGVKYCDYIGTYYSSE